MNRATLVWGTAIGLAIALLVVWATGARQPASSAPPLVYCACPDALHVDIRFPEHVNRDTLDAVQAACERFCVVIGVGRWGSREPS